MYIQMTYIRKCAGRSALTLTTANTYKILYYNKKQKTKKEIKPVLGTV